MFGGKEKVPSVKKIDVSGPKQKERGRQNFVYEYPDGNRIFEKNVHNTESRPTQVDDMIRERFLLGKLVDSGITPAVKDFKIFDDGNSASLRLEMMPGISLFRSEMRTKKMKAHAEEIIHATASNLAYLHKQDILIGDINDGTFLIEDTDDEISSHLVDLELGIDLNTFDEDEKKRLYQFYIRKEPGLKRSSFEENHAPTNDLLKQSDIAMWANTMIEWLLRGEKDKRKGFEQTSIDLRKALKERHIDLSEQTITFLEKSINPNIIDRAINLSELVSE